MIRDLKPFVIVAAAWAVLGGTLCLVFSAMNFGLSLAWMFLFWGLCLVDLTALAKTIFTVLALMEDAPEKRAARTIQAFYWATLKLVCLGIIGLILFRGSQAESSIPSVGMLTGLATLVVVPLAGGFWWSQRELRA